MATKVSPIPVKALAPEARVIATEPYYEPAGNEVALFEAAWASTLPVLLKGPTGCGKTRFIEHMAWRLKRPLITVSCHDDLTAADLVGRYLITSNETVWVDGPLAHAVRAGAICYLDEVVEARRDTTVVIHPLADDRRILPMEKRGELLQAPPEFLLAMSYNPGYQSVLKELKQSTRQRFVAIDFQYPPAALEEKIITTEAGADAAIDAQPEGQRSRRGRINPATGACRKADGPWHSAGRCLPRRDCRGTVRRS
jgi:nitric oxide reductase NorQ protein